MKPFIRVAALFSIVFASRSLTTVHAQTPAAANPKPVFEVASVKPNKSGTTQANVGMPPNGVNFVNLPLQGIIQLSYGINQPSKLIGIPEWAFTERFDIQARAAGTVTADERRLMMQALLADRFKLNARIEKREVSVLALVLARNDGRLGPKLIESKGCIQPGNPIAAEPPPAGNPLPTCGPKPGGVGKLILVGNTMQQLTALLALMIHGTVADKTGLTGRYDLELTYAPNQPLPAGLDAALPATAPAPDPNGPSLYTALREQLGLKLESQKVMEEVLVIDHVERPSGN